jgi:exodeoxyribonuclease VII small subunit
MTNKLENPSYQDLKADLDAVMMRLQSDELDVDEALQLYQKGQELIKELEGYLKQAENTINKIKTNFEA